MRRCLPWNPRTPTRRTRARVFSVGELVLLAGDRGRAGPGGQFAGAHGDDCRLVRTATHTRSRLRGRSPVATLASHDHRPTRRHFLRRDRLMYVGHFYTLAVAAAKKPLNLLIPHVGTELVYGSSGRALWVARGELGEEQENATLGKIRRRFDDCAIAGLGRAGAGVYGASSLSELSAHKYNREPEGELHIGRSSGWISAPAATTISSHRRPEFRSIGRRRQLFNDLWQSHG